MFYLVNRRNSGRQGIGTYPDERAFSEGTGTGGFAQRRLKRF